ncbi:tyrosine-protein phosphatase [Novosphingobium sp. PASSN1]|uniref:tyrosine-protein phosphatase n=1 Tax=Novosphingobium sp. PASSN1 TaxID=2015561 RepID=UPI000BDBDB53|nr:tyrosine-protein phosphatase [Novosphingobium sp. PASSN1]OYU34702.1 MAG: protein-tyrosine-phosphatase [Novosphingobium sp. PASSN1]
MALALAAAGIPPLPLMAEPPAIPAASEHQRVLPLQGGRNFRDLGGYRTADGRTIKWNMLFRSGSMTDLTQSDFAYLEGLGIRVVIDLRDNRERAAEPVSWPGPTAPLILTDDYLLDYGASMPAGPVKTWSPDQARASLVSSYQRMPAQFNGQYRRLFAQLLTGKAPLAVNCSAGKDRTGIAAALLLTALGVPRKRVIEDYLLTNQTLNSGLVRTGKATADGPWNDMQPEAFKAFIDADRTYIQAALSVVDSHKDGVAGYLREELGLGPKELRDLRNRYLE